MKELIIFLMGFFITLFIFGVSIPMAICYGVVSVITWYALSPFFLIMAISYEL
ncbi:hypothetical protein MOC16_gp275 [Klebsiella phage vB_KpM_FBKp24]|uniref:Uncharacterized protein n=1 Tax=Klebsiella phage vB_KpM_FBKp24 TaxID=2801834 RepID=A0A7U0GBZ1_9CAUD|nr:hypothetical protein MOC16_gp275 [Klebsiella phage vB_KpM_FBKp24]QQV92355.1 hypothetical protein vBKpMFBKp24_138 [Klebsiella phage vB_KpM_FBKp24]